VKIDKQEIEEEIRGYCNEIGEQENIDIDFICPYIKDEGSLSMKDLIAFEFSIMKKRKQYVCTKLFMIEHHLAKRPQDRKAMYHSTIVRFNKIVHQVAKPSDFEVQYYRMYGPEVLKEENNKLIPAIKETFSLKKVYKKIKKDPVIKALHRARRIAVVQHKLFIQKINAEIAKREKEIEDEAF
jgi:hypothetical protein